MTTCEAYWNKVLQFVDTNDSNGFYQWCENKYAPSCSRDKKKALESDWAMAQEYRKLKDKLGEKTPAEKSVLRPLIAKRNEKIREKVILSLENFAKSPTAKITAKVVNHIIAKLHEEIESDPFKPELYTVWHFAKFDKRFGRENYPGRIPAQLIQNVLYYFTNENDIIVDPMVGGGTTMDIAKAMNRKCFAYDIAPIRPEIEKHDIRNGFPQETKGCDLIFLDPPYWSMKGGNYEWGDPILDASAEKFYEFISKIAKDCFETLKPYGYVSLLMMNQTDKDLEDQPYIDHIFNCYKLFLEAGFRAVQRISCPLSTQQYSGFDVKRAKEEKRLLGIVRDLIIFQKV